MNQPMPNENNQPSAPSEGIRQQVENSTLGGGMQATQGNKNVQVHGEGNVLTFNQTEILQISEKEITSRELNRTSPYKGLKQFESRDKELFFGRDNFITSLVNKLEQTNLILLLGASGSGKSSVVRAGLIPWLEKKYGKEFTNLTFTPDADPFESFYASLLSNKYQQAEAKIAKEVKAETLVKVVNNLKQPDEFWFIFIDQFEELFTTSDENKRREFVNGLMKLSQAKLPNVNNNLKIMATMRADFFERLGDFAQLVEATQEHRPMIVEMQSSELRLAIEQPAAHHGVVFETGLVDKIIAEVQGQAGCLPLLQYTLNLVWDSEVKTGSINDRTLNIDTYQDVGGVKGALQEHVNKIYQNLSPPEKLAAQRIFLKLVGIGENAAEGAEWKPVRRRALLSEFGDDERDVLLKLVNENLLVSDADLSVTDSKKGLFGSSKSQKSNSTIEITHEILLTSWDKLHNWIQKNRQGIALRNRLYEDVKRWLFKKPEDELWTGSKLEQVLELRKDDNFNQVLGGFNQSANQFIDASVGLRDRQLTRARIIAGVGFTLAALASVASVFAFIQQQSAQKKSIISMTQTVESRLLVNNQFDAILEAIKAKKELKNVWIGKDDVTLLVLGSLGQAVHHNQKGWKERLRLQGTDIIFSPNGKHLATLDGNIVRLWDANTGKQLQEFKGHDETVKSVVFSPDGKLLATASEDNTARLWDANTGKLLHTLKGHESSVLSVEFSPDGKLLATASAFEDNTARLWDANTGKLLQQLKGHKNSVYRVVFSPDGKLLATASEDNTARLWDANTGKLLQEFKGHEDSVWSVEFSPDGKLLATASEDNTARLWDANTGKLLQQLKGHLFWVASVEFSPDGKLLATASGDKTARLWDANTGKQLQEFKGHERGVRSVVFSPDGKLLATASGDKTARLWDANTGEQLQELKGHESPVTSVEFSSDGKQLASASDDKTARLWDANTGKQLHTLKGHEDLVYRVEFSPDGKQLATASWDKTARLWDSNTGKQLQQLKGHEDLVTSVEFSPDGKLLASASDDKTARLWDANTGKQLHTLKGHDETVTSVVFSPDGKLLATASGDGTARLWDFNTGKQLQEFKGDLFWVTSVVFSPDGKLLATASRDKTARLWDANTGKQLQELKGHESPVLSVVFSPDGKLLATASLDNTARLWDANTGKQLHTLKGHERGVLSVVFSPDGKLLATASDDNTARLWDANTGKQLHTLKGHERGVLSVVFSPDGKLLATASLDNTARLWDANTGKQLQELKGHERGVLSVVFSPDGKQIATASWVMARLWQVGDIEDMLAINCDWVHHYLESKPDNDEDRDLCDGVKSFKD